MKIYFAYRTGYVPNNRIFKTFEAKSVFDWFVKHWDILSDDEDKAIEKLLSVRPYGFPISDYESEEKVSVPTDLDDLQEKIESFVYSNEVNVTDNYVSVFTDDDEIELAWYIFDEKFALENPDKVNIWFNENLPTEFKNSPFAGKLDGKAISAKGVEKCNTYYMSSTIYDSSHIEDLEGVYRIEGVSVPELVEYLRKNNSLKIEEEDIYGLDEIRLIQKFAKLFPDHNQKEIFEELTQHSANDLLNTFKIKEINLSVLEKVKIREADSDNKLTYSEHLIEISTSVSEFYNYTIIFDDFWLNKNQDLAKSLANFCTTWEI